jgi:hypothetical protein
MLKRLEGIVMIINTFMPLIVLLGITVLGWAFVHTVREAAREPLARIGGSIARMEVTIGEAKTAAGELTDAVIEGVAKPIQAAADAIGAIPVSIHIDMPALKIPNARLPIQPNVSVEGKPGFPPVDVRIWMSEVNVRMPTIPAVKLPEVRIPGLQGIKKLFADLFDNLARFVDVLKRIAGIGGIGREAAAVSAAAADFVQAIRAATAWILTTAITLLYLGAGWFLLCYAMWVHRRRRLGWALVRGGG